MPGLVGFKRLPLASKSSTGSATVLMVANPAFVYSHGKPPRESRKKVLKGVATQEGNLRSARPQGGPVQLGGG